MAPFPSIPLFPNFHPRDMISYFDKEFDFTFQSNTLKQQTEDLTDIMSSINIEESNQTNENAVLGQLKELKISAPTVKNELGHVDKEAEPYIANNL